MKRMRDNLTKVTRGAAMAVLAVSAAGVSSLGVSSSAFAGGYAVKEQSASGLGAAWAGVAAGTDLSSIFWNPAAVTITDHMRAEVHGALIFPDTTITPRTGSLRPLTDPQIAGAGFTLNNEVDIGKFAAVPASYAGYNYNDALYLGLGVNSPFGLVTEADPRGFAGQYHGRRSEIFTINVNPVVGYRFNPQFAVAGGVQIQYIDAELRSAFFNPLLGINPSPNNPDAVVGGDDIGFGVTVGALFTPMPGTQIGLGFRSAVSHTLKGQFNIDHAQANAALTVPIEAKITTPEIVTLSVRHGITDYLTLMGTVEWTHWSRLKDLRIVATGSSRGPRPAFTPGSTVSLTEFNWDDSWMISGGAEYRVNDKLTARFGLAYETSPVPDATRGPRLPDSDRIWASIGATYQYNDHISFDLGYTHVFFKDAKINLSQAALPEVPFALVADTKNNANIIAASVKVTW